MAGLSYDASRSERGRPDCRMIDRNVPVFSSRCIGTGTVVVAPSCLFCTTTWLPRRLISAKPCLAMIRHTSLPDSLASLANADLQTRHEDFRAHALFDF